jgi:DNA-binding MarR family transcriptional regulator
MTGVIDRLERDKLALRVRNTGDRRVVHVNLTPQGKRQGLKLLKTAKESMATLMTILDAGDRADLIRILHKVNDRLTRLTSNAKLKSGGTSK